METMRLPFAEQEPIRCTAADDGLSDKQWFVRAGENEVSQALAHRHMQPGLRNKGPIVLTTHMVSGILPPLPPLQGILTQWTHLVFLMALTHLEQ